MDTVTCFFYPKYASPRWTYDSLKNLGQISPAVQTHLKRVYLFVCAALVAAAVGVYLHFLWNIGGLLTAVGAIGCANWLKSTPPNPNNQQKKVSLLMAAALLQGASIGPLVEFLFDIDPSIPVTAFVGCALAFGCFSGAAILARRREYLYLGGVLSSCLSILFWLHVAGPVFSGSMTLFKFELYFGFLVFLGFIVVDTQFIIEKAHHGDMDYVNHALTLFTDFIAVFIRILIIMSLNSAGRKEKKKERKN